MSNGFAEALAKYTPVFPVRVTIGDGIGKEVTGINIVATAKGSSTSVQHVSHAIMVAKAAAQLDPANINIIDAWGGGSTPFGYYDGLIESLRHNPVALATPYNIDTTTMAAYVAGMAEDIGAVWVGPSVDSTDIPASIGDRYSNTLVAQWVTPTGVLRGLYREEAIAVEASNHSVAVGKLAGAYAWLKSIAPTNTHEEILAAIHATAEPRIIGEHTVNWLRLDRAADMLTGGAIPAPAPVPTPEPEPEYMQIAENELVRLECPESIVNEERGEGLQNCLTDDRHKTLWWEPHVALQLTVKQPCILRGLRTANDAPSRDIAVVEVDNWHEYTQETRARHTYTPLIHRHVLDPGTYILEIENRGAPYTQVEWLDFEAVTSGDVPQERYIASITIEYSDGEQEVWMP